MCAAPSSNLHCALSESVRLPLVALPALNGTRSCHASTTDWYNVSRHAEYARQLQTCDENEAFRADFQRAARIAVLQEFTARQSISIQEEEELRQLLIEHNATTNRRVEVAHDRAWHPEPNPPYPDMNCFDHPHSHGCHHDRARDQDHTTIIPLDGRQQLRWETELGPQSQRHYGLAHERERRKFGPE